MDDLIVMGFRHLVDPRRLAIISCLSQSCSSGRCSRIQRKVVHSCKTSFVPPLQAAYHGVPIVGIPVFGDQPDNVMKAVYRGFGLMISPGAS